MKRYNRDKRAKYNAQNKIMQMHDSCNAQNTRKTSRIHIHVKYDGYNKTIYIPVVYGKTRDTRARTYIGMTNAIRQIFPELDKAHTQPTHRANAPYKQFIPPRTNYTRPKEEEYIRNIYREERVKCIIYNEDGDKMIHYGIFIRSIHIYGDDITYKLHRNKRSIQIYPYMPIADKINGVDIHEIWAHNVEIYKI